MTNKGIQDSYHMMKRMWPEFYFKVCAIKKASNVVGDSSMVPFNWSILVGSANTRRLYGVAMLFKQLMYFWVSVEFTALIHHDMFVVASWRMRFKEHS